MSFRKHYSLTGNKGKLERLGNISPGRVLPATDLAAQDPGTTNASLPNAAIKCSGEKPTHTYFWHIHITAPQASTSADSSTAENSTIAAMWRLRADLPTAAFVLVPAFIPGRNETTSHVTFTCATDNLSVCFMDPGDFHQWVPLPLAPRHQRTRRTASTSRWVGRGRTGTARVFLWAEGWGCALGSGLCLWEALQSRIPRTFPSARVPRSPAGHPPRLKVGLQPAQGTAGASPGEKHSCRLLPHRTPLIALGWLCSKRAKLTTLWELGVVGAEQRHRGLHVPSPAHCWNNSPHPTEVSRVQRAIPGFFYTCPVLTRSGSAADLACKSRQQEPAGTQWLW